ncbi:MAG: WhiB family transcriptional regulator [Propionibacteriaceae bacterium]|jgi:hypothetical protein|nr:WhiB family transcriptional regulator [Propionibacteriaceae bacterium]
MNTTYTTLRRNNETTASCSGLGNLFLHPLLDDDHRTPLSNEQLRAQRMMQDRAQEICSTCPMISQCLYNSVVRHDVAGYVAGTTAKQRTAIRSRLGWRVKPENLDIFAGVVSGHAVDHDEVLRMRRSNPNETLETLAERLGCSLSTIKRHLRMARALGEEDTPAPRLQLVPPSAEQVFSATRDVLSGARRRTATRELTRAA